MAITSNLYPPIVSDTLPAFIRTKNCRIYFSLSIYNNISDIQNVQISLINQRTNASAFKPDLYPSGIKIATIYKLNDEDDLKDIHGDQIYYVQILTTDLIENAFSLNQFYKVQLRFTSMAASTPQSTGKELATWLYNNMQYFSEWSKVCLIKGIEQPIISIRGFENADENQQTILTNSMINIIGELSYEHNGLIESEYLKSYNIKICPTNNNNNILVNSGEIYTNPYNPNEFDYQITTDLLDGVNYTLFFTYTTNNLYTETLSYDFTIIQYGVDKINANITAIPDEQNGRIKIDIVAKDTQVFIGNLTIRRTSSQSNFHKWEDVKTVTYLTGTELNYSWYDTTIESGIWYKYCAQKRNSRGDRGAIIQIQNPVICVLDDIFLTKNNCQLKIRFNPSLNEFKYNVTESQQVTIGSKFPYIKRNGANYFRSFPIGGLISSFIDTTDWYDPHFYDGEFHNNENEIKAFTSKTNIYGQAESLYENYNNKMNITEYNDYIYEREFRKRVYDFLYANDVKLFRSTTEGNILIKLMNIDFQPVETLGRRLYSFTATAVQIDEANIINYNKYGIQITGDYETYINYKHEVLGQISGTYSDKDGNILNNQINAKYEKIANKGFKNEIKSLKWLKLEIESDPYVIIEENGRLEKATTNSTIDLSNTTLGYIVSINGTEMIIHPSINKDSNGKTIYSGFLELKQENTVISDLKFKYPTTVTVNYIANLEEIEDTSQLATKIYYYRKPGQLYGNFNPQDSLMQKIYNKYLLKYKKYYQKLLEVNDIQIEGPSGAVIYVKDSKDIDFNRHVLENGYLQLKDDNVNIEGLYFCGIHLTECKNPLETQIINGITEKDFVLQSGTYNNLDQIKNPKNGGIYQILSYGLQIKASLENHRVLLVNKNNTEYTIVSPNTNYKLLLDSIKDDDKAKFVYYYGSWYLLSKAPERTKLLQHDIRHLRDNEYILVNEYYDSFSEITNPIPNGVYWISSYEVDDPLLEFNQLKGILTISPDYAYKNIDENYSLIIKQVYNEAKDRYIYYHNKWYPFTATHDVLCPVDGIVNYSCEVMKGVY